MSDRFTDAISLQDACNPTGVAHAFNRAAEVFRASPEHKGTASLCADPALRLMVFKIADLMSPGCIPLDIYMPTYDECLLRALKE